MKKRILFLFLSPNQYWKSALSTLKSNGFEFYLPQNIFHGGIITKNEFLEDISDCVNFYETPISLKHHCLPNFEDMLQSLNKIKPDIVFSLERNIDSLKYAVWCKQNKTKFVISTDLGYTACDRHCAGLSRKLVHNIIDKYLIDAFFCTTLPAYLNKASSGKPSIFAPIHHFWTHRAPKAKSFDDSTIKFIYVGRMVKEKNVHKLVQAFISLDKKCDKKIELHLCGTGNLDDYIKSRQNSNIIFHGFVKYNDLFDVISECDILILPSSGDTYGIPVHEALSCGLPVISTTRVGSVYSHIQNYYNGLVYNQDNELELKMSEIINSDDLRKLLTANAFKSLDRYNLHSQSLNLCSFFRSL